MFAYLLKVSSDWTAHIAHHLSSALFAIAAMSSSSRSSSRSSDTALTTPVSPTDGASLSKRPLYTTSSVFLKTLSEAGVTHIFANWGNDHPAILEDLERQRSERGGKALLEIVTCPNEMVALSAAQGYAQVTGKPAAVIVHVDVGTQVSVSLGL